MKSLKNLFIRKQILHILVAFPLLPADQRKEKKKKGKLNYNCSFFMMQRFLLPEQFTKIERCRQK